MRLTSQEVYDKLINEDRILELQGQIRFYLGDVDIIVHQKKKPHRSLSANLALLSSSLRTQPHCN